MSLLKKKQCQDQILQWKKNNLKLFKAKYIITCDNNFTILEDGGVVVEDGIIKAIDSFDVLQAKYQNCLITDCGKNSILMPGLINPHVHLEFSNNKTSLEYGNFITWLYRCYSK